jgi:hypothetical protein
MLEENVRCGAVRLAREILLDTQVDFKFVRRKRGLETSLYAHDVRG